MMTTNIKDIKKKVSVPPWLNCFTNDSKKRLLTGPLSYCFSSANLLATALIGHIAFHAKVYSLYDVDRLISISFVWCGVSCFEAALSPEGITSN